jgi:hypothetical protein
MKRQGSDGLRVPEPRPRQRRGGEVIGRQGGAAPDFAFATLYGIRRFRHGASSPPGRRPPTRRERRPSRAARLPLSGQPRGGQNGEKLAPTLRIHGSAPMPSRRVP